MRRNVPTLIQLAAVLAVCADARAQFVQQGSKLVGSGNTALSAQGSSVALSADGNTAIVGGPQDGSATGAAWIWTRSGGVWTQQGGKLVGTGAAGAAQQGTSVALSADGNTAIVGGFQDNSGAGAAWVWTRSGGVWSQQGGKLVGSGNTGSANQGVSVALSADGNTALVGGNSDNVSVGAAWVWTRSGGVWTQQGGKLVGSGAAFSSNQGRSVGLSADGNTALVGGYGDNLYIGAAWVWTRSGSVWTQQGTKLVGSGAVGLARQGWAVALSADGNTALVGGTNDNAFAGAAWVWTRNGGVWSQQGSKLVGSGAVGTTANQGAAVALSADGRVALVGGYGDTSVTGATWVWTRFAGVWTQQGSKLVGTGAAGAAGQGRSVAISGDGHAMIEGASSDNIGVGAAWVFMTAAPGDLSCDDSADILWRNTSGANAVWFMSGASVIGGDGIGPADTSWQIAGTRDFNADGCSDILWRQSSGSIALWLMRGASIIGGGGIGVIDPAWQIAGTGDFDGNGRADILWRNTSGEVAIWLMNGTTVLGGGGIGVVDPSWQIAGTGDYNADGKADIVWRHTSGAVAIWFMNGAATLGGGSPGAVDPVWQIAGTGDYNGDGRADLLWRNTASGDVVIWLMNGALAIGGGEVGIVDLAWQVAATADYNGDGKSDILFRHTSGTVTVWLMNGTAIVGGGTVTTVDPAWQIVPIR